MMGHGRIKSKLSPTGWALRISISLVFLVFALEKLMGSGWIKLFADIGFGQWFRYFTGVVQLTGAVLYGIPRTSLAGMVLLACSMLGAVGVHLFVLHTGVFAAFIPGVLIGVIVAGWSLGESNREEEIFTIR
jgi:hypothetical protein